MTKINVPAHEAGVIRIFAIDLPEDQIKAFQTATYTEDGDLDRFPLKDALGADHIDEDFIEIARLKDLEDYGFDQYLITGMGVPASEVAAHSVTLNALKGHVLIVMSSAFDGAAQALDVKPPLRHVLTFNDDREPVKFDPLPSEAAKGTLEPPVTAPKSDARIGGMVATVALLVLFALVGVMIWVGG